MLRTRLSFITLAALLTVGCSETMLERPEGAGPDRTADGALKIATWNMEWLHRHNGAGHVPRGNADYERIAHYASLLDADIVALQEVDGIEAAQRVFDPSEYDFHMSSRSSTQRTGFAYRKGLDVTANPDYTALASGNLRRGTDLSVEVEGETLRLLNIHLKSGCFSQSLNSSSSSCSTLANQIDRVEDWIDARVVEGVPSMVLGDFNRRLFASANDDAWAELNDGTPAGAELSSPTDSGTAQCNGGKFPEFIDHLVTTEAATSKLVEGSFEQLIYSDADGGFELPDHCPLSIQIALGGDGEPEPDPNSCEGACGGKAPGGCWCDEQCESFGNCCADKVAVCDVEPEPEPEPDPNSCEGSCGGKAPGGCWCDEQCESFGNCCADKVAVCDAVPEPEPEPDPEPEPEPDPNSCEGSCGEKAPGGCWCDGLCESYGDCCSDVSTYCG